MLLASLKNISLSYGDFLALDRITLDIEEGGHFALLGANGSGKSTLLKVLRAEAFPRIPEDGHLLWQSGDGMDSSPLSGRALSALVSVGQAEAYMRNRWEITGMELVAGGLYDSPVLYGALADEDRQAVEMLAGRLDILDLMEQGIDCISQMQLFMLLFARAVVRKPRLLLLDEFIDGLDQKWRKVLFTELEALAEESTLGFATHRHDNLPTSLGKIIHMENGRIVDVPATLKGSSEKPVGVQAADNASNLQVAGGDGACENTQAVKPALAFDLQGVTVFIDSVELLHDISWQVATGEDWVVTGPAGSGKSLLLRLLAGELYVAYGGRLERFAPGVPRPLESLAETRQHIRLVSGDLQAGYPYNLSGLDMLLSGVEGSLGLFIEPSAAEIEEARYWLERLEVPYLADKPIRSMSTGQLRRLLLGRSLMGSPKVLLLDDPFSGLDKYSRALVADIIDDLRKKTGLQSIMVTRYAEDAMVHGARIASMDGGYLHFL